MTALEAGTVATLTVEREAPYGFFLTSGDEDVLLHKNEITDPLELGDDIQVFLYRDKENRLAATMTIPKIQVGTYGWAEVVEVQRPLGVFVDIGIQKDILVSRDVLPRHQPIWPEKGDRLLVTLERDSQGRLLAVPATEEIIQQIMKPAKRDLLHQNLEGHVYRNLKIGTFVISKEGYRGFIHESQRKREPRLGEKVNGRVTKINEDGSVNLSLLLKKEDALEEDAEMIYAYMKGRGGAMPYSDKTHPDDIKSIFGISKAAFKRALGKLMKENKVYQEDGWTFLRERK
ncbi:MAG: hypothetical protein H0Z33_00045 [Bacillaceae bacterium]|nr:hypothetical protein [Bacillaceae bacterium]